MEQTGVKACLPVDTELRLVHETLLGLLAKLYWLLEYYGSGVLGIVLVFGNL